MRRFYFPKMDKTKIVIDAFWETGQTKHHWIKLR